jgi:hypothetical protein
MVFTLDSDSRPVVVLIPPKLAAFISPRAKITAHRSRWETEG